MVLQMEFPLKNLNFLLVAGPGRKLPKGSRGFWRGIVPHSSEIQAKELRKTVAPKVSLGAPNV